jgi:hypothetical protein
MFQTTADGNFRKVGTNETHSPQSPEYLAWLAAGNTPTPYIPPPPEVPFSVTPFQAKAAILQAGLLPAVEAALAAASPIAQLAWSDAVAFTRDSPTINSLAAQLGLTPAQVDDLFTVAAAIEA